MPLVFSMQRVYTACQSSYELYIMKIQTHRILSTREGGGGGTLNFLYICRLGLFIGVQNVEFQYFWGVFRKNEYILRYEDFVDIFFWVTIKLTYIYGSFLCILGSFLKSKVQNGHTFLGC